MAVLSRPVDSEDTPSQRMGRARAQPNARCVAARPTCGHVEMVVIEDGNGVWTQGDVKDCLCQIDAIDLKEISARLPSAKQFTKSGCPLADAQEFAVGQRVEARDGEDAWKRGIVVSASPLKVRPDSGDEDFAFDEVRASDPKAQAFTVGDTVAIDGHAGIVQWDGRPNHQFVTVVWEDDGSTSDLIQAGMVMPMQALTVRFGDKVTYVGQDQRISGKILVSGTKGEVVDCTHPNAVRVRFPGYGGITLSAGEFVKDMDAGIAIQQVPTPTFHGIRRVHFDVDVTVHEIAPYAEIYGAHPREFVFGRNGCMIPADPGGFVGLSEIEDDIDNSSDSDDDGADEQPIITRQPRHRWKQCARSDGKGPLSTLCDRRPFQRWQRTAKVGRCQALN